MHGWKSYNRLARSTLKSVGPGIEKSDSLRNANAAFAVGPRTTSPVMSYSRLLIA